MKWGKTKKIVSDARYSISSGTGSSELRITNVSAVDEGFYICDATVNELNEAKGYLQILQGTFWFQFLFSSYTKEYKVVDFCIAIDCKSYIVSCVCDLEWTVPGRISQSIYECIL